MTALFRGAEDMHFSPIGVPAVDQTAGHFRASYARCALQASGNFTGVLPSTDTSNSPLTQGWRIPSSYGIVVGNFWFTARVFNVNGGDTAGGSGLFWNALGPGDITRLQIRRTGSGTPPIVFEIVKVNAAGVATRLTTFTGGVATGAVTKFDVHVNYATNGFITVYFDGDILANYSGDVTTDGATTITGVDMGSWSAAPASVSYTSWSEIIWDTTDTRSMGLVTVYPTATGNLDQWTGTFGDVTQIINNDLSFNSAGASNLVQLYNNNSLPAGEFSIVDFTSTARAISSGVPATYDFELVTHAVTYDSPVQTPGGVLGLQWYTWATNPNTSLPWTIAEANVLQQGMKSLT